MFDAHIEGIVMGEGRSVPERWYVAPFCCFSNPHAITGPGDPIQGPRGPIGSTWSWRWPRSSAPPGGI